MQLEQAFSLEASPDAVWTAFHDIELLVACLPGASIREGHEGVSSGSEIPLLFKVKLGPIAAGFAGLGQLTLDEHLHTGSFAGGAVDSKTHSRVRGEARFALEPADTGTRVILTVDYTVTGALAQFSREGIMRALAEQLTRQFANNLQVRLPQASTPVAATSHTVFGSNTTADAAHPAAPSATARDAVSQCQADTSSIDLWTLFKAWLRSLFARKPG